MLRKLDLADNFVEECYQEEKNVKGTCHWKHQDMKNIKDKFGSYQ